MARRRNPSAGSILFVVATALTFIQVLFLSFYGRSLDSRKLARRVFSRDLSAQLADAARASAVNALRQDVTTPRTSRFLTLFVSGGSGLTEGVAVPMRDGWDSLVKEYAASYGATVTSTLRLVNVGGLDAATVATGFDALEKSGLVELKVSVSVRNVSLPYVYRIPFKVVNLLPPVVSRFALFVQKPIAFDPSRPLYTLDQNRSSDPSTSQTSPPLTVRNAREKAAPVLDDPGRGYIFFGQSQQPAPQMVTIPYENGTVHFQGDLNQVDTTTLGTRTVILVAHESDFKAKFIVGNRLRLGCVVKILLGGLTLPADLEVEDGGVIMASGAIASNGVRNRSDVPLTLCSLTSSVQVDTRYEQHEFAAVALKGRLDPVGDRPLSMKGSVAVGSIDGLSVPRGSELTYDSRLDPSAPSYRNYYRAFFGDFEEEWGMP
ncbi:MAG: hypothetical protein HY815_22545 [Candidatus Riflebacteria bacterium]|nr:hypothetical protein [Candidatus Riflebacteria bacterium]